MRLLGSLTRVTARLIDHLLRMALPFAGLAAYHEGRGRGWIDDPSWILVIGAALLLPFIATQRRAEDGLAMLLLLVVGVLGFALSGQLAAAVLGLGWLAAMILSARLLHLLTAAGTSLA